MSNDQKLLVFSFGLNMYKTISKIQISSLTCKKLGLTANKIDINKNKYQIQFFMVYNIIK